MGESTMIDLRLGRWQDVLADVEQVDAVITDPPYNERTAKGYRTNPDWTHEIGSQPGVAYGSISHADVCEFVASWWPRCRHWFIVFSDHTGTAWWADELACAGAYVFAPVVWIKTDGPPRFLGDGPTSSAEYITVARHGHTVANGSPRRGSRPGYYLVSSRHGLVTGGKDPAGMGAIIRDYTLPGDLICDPCSGGATTLIAAAIEGRRSVGSETDPDTYTKAKARIAGGYTPMLPGFACG